MARKPRDHRLETREARARLKQSHEIYKRSLSPGLFIGYRKNKSGGVWYSIRFEKGRYQKRAIGFADDFTESEEHSLERQNQYLSYSEAVKKIFSGVKDAAKRRGRWTVNDAADAYLEWFKLNRRSYTQTRQAIDCHIRPRLGELKLDDLTQEIVSRWLNSIAQSSPLLRSTSAKRNFRAVDLGDHETLRKRKSTANRVLNILKALLNYSLRLRKVSSNEAWNHVQSFHDVDSQREVFLSDDECSELIEAKECSPEMRDFILGALLTGARPGELRQVIVKDFQNRRFLRIRADVSKTGKERIIPLNKEGRDLFSKLSESKSSNEFIFIRADGTQWNSKASSREFKKAVVTAKLPKDTVLYSLRHVFGTKHIENGTPVKSLAEIMGCSVRIIEKYYVKTSERHLTEMAERNSPSFLRGTVIPFAKVENG